MPGVTALCAFSQSVTGTVHVFIMITMVHVKTLGQDCAFHWGETCVFVEKSYTSIYLKKTSFILFRV